jgi:hypothetical protein
VCLFSLISCEKDISPANPDVIADKYVGKYLVSEDTKILANPAFFQHYDFEGSIIKGDSSDRIKLIQSSRIPKPVWAGWSADTIEYKIYPLLKDSIRHSRGGIAYGRILHLDTIKLRYEYGAGVNYTVNQLWVRKK